MENLDLLILLLLVVIAVLFYSKFNNQEDFAKKKKKKKKNKNKKRQFKKNKLNKNFQIVNYYGQNIAKVNNVYMPYKNITLPGLNKYIEAVWCTGAYAERNDAPATTVLLPYSNSHHFLYGNNWETSWWLKDQTNDTLIVQFDKTRFVSNIEALNYATYGNENGGYLEVYECSEFNSNQIVNPTLLGAIAINNNKQLLGSLNVQRDIRVLMFLRKNVSGWSKLENIIIN